MSELDEFLHSGLKHYGTAIRTANRFAKEVEPILNGLLQEPLEAGRISASDTPSFKAWTRSGPWMHSKLWVDVGEPEPAQLELGVWWSRESTGSECVFYIGFNDGPEWTRRGIQPLPEQRATCLDRGRYAYFVRPAEEGAPLEEQAKALLDEFLDALDTVRAGRPPPAPADGTAP